VQGLTPAFIERCLEDGREQGRLEAVVLFADLQGFTGYTERMLALGKEGAERLSLLLDRVFGAAAEAIHGRGGFIPHFAGDAFAGVFPGEDTVPALEAAGAIQEAMTRLAIDIPLRVGIGQGPVDWRITAGDPRRWYLRGPGMASAVAAQQQAVPGQICLDRGLAPLSGDFAWEDQTDCRVLRTWSFGLPVEDATPAGPGAETFYPAFLRGHLQGGEFRTVTSMFLALSGDTGEEALNAWLIPVCHLLERHRAYVKEMDFTDKGGLLVAFFGAPVSAGDSRRLAVEAGLAALALPESGPVGLHVGLATGPAFCGLAGNAYRRQYIVAGRSVNLAARLAMRGQPGQLLSDQTSLGGLDARTRDLGPLPAKGFAEPVPVFAIERLVPPPAGESTAYRPEAVIHTLARDLLAVPGRILQICGEPGVGKTFEARMLTRHTAAALRWLCVEGQRARSDAFEALDVAWQALEEPDDRPGLAQALGQIREMRRRDELPPRERYAHLEQMHRRLLAQPPGTGSMAVWVEHWEDLDQDSRELLLQSAGRGEIRILLTARTPVAMPGCDNLHHHQLEGLDPQGVQALVRHLLGALPAPPLEALLLQAASGNPFYSAQLLLYLRDNGLLYTGEEGQVMVRESEIRLGDSLRDILLARLDQLEPGLRDMLRVAAVIGPRFDQGLLEEVLQRLASDPPGLADALDAAVEADMLRPEEGGFRFLHSLLREVLYELQLSSRLRTLHQHILRAMAQRFGEDPGPHYRDMAGHAARAGLDGEASRYYTLAARRALGAYQNREALLLFREALPHCHEPADRAALLLEQNVAAVALGQWGPALEGLQDPAFEQTGDPGLLAGRELARGQIHLLSGHYPEAAHCLGEAYERYASAGDSIGMARCTRELSILHFRKGDYPLAEEFIARTFALLPDRRDNDHALVVNLALIRMNQGRYTEAEQLLYDELILRLQTDERQPLTSLYVNLGVVQNEMGHYAQGLEHIGKGYAIAEEAGSRLWMSIALGTRGLIRENTGHWDLARADYLADLDMARELGDPQGTAIGQELLGSLMVRCGEFEEGCDLLRRSLDTCRQLGYRKGLVKSLLSLGQARLWQEDPEGAGDLLQEALHSADAMGNRRLQAQVRLALAGVALYRERRDEALSYWEAASGDVLAWDEPGLLRQWLALQLRLAEAPAREALWETTIRESADPWLRAEALRLRWAAQGAAADRDQALHLFRSEFRGSPFVLTRRHIQALENS
jgi:class 3 adenylate cyclase/tetratricopeptide (TPR) repeat protein